jgi:hypothetical protein
MRRKATWIAIVSFIGILFSGALADQEARQQGFLDVADMRAAKDAGISDPAAWQHHREQLAKQRQEAEHAEAERAKAKAEACERDLECIGNEKSVEAAFACRAVGRTHG